MMVGQKFLYRLRHNGVREKGDVYEMQKRMSLKLFRISKNLSQQEFADVLGVPRQTYAMVERGQRRGSRKLWQQIQTSFCVSDVDMLAMYEISEKQREWQREYGVSDDAMWKLINKGV